MRITKKLIDQYLKQKLGTDVKWACGALLRIYDRQTAGEQSSMSTHENNNVGFTGADAEILTSFANQYKARGFLSPKQMAILFRKAPKYHKQILSIGNLDKLLNFMVKDGLITTADVTAWHDSQEAKAFIKAL